MTLVADVIYMCRFGMSLAPGSTIFMMTSSNGTFSSLQALHEENSPVNSELPSQKAVMRSFDIS